MLVNMMVPVVALDTNAAPVELKNGAGSPLLREILLFALREVHFEIDKNLGAKEKLDRFLLERRIDPQAYDKKAATPDTVELTEGEIKMVTERVGRIFLQAGLSGAVSLLLDTTVVPPCQVPTPVENEANHKLHLAAAAEMGLPRRRRKP